MPSQGPLRQCQGLWSLKYIYFEQQRCRLGTLVLVLEGSEKMQTTGLSSVSGCSSSMVFSFFNSSAEANMSGSHTLRIWRTF